MQPSASVHLQRNQIVNKETTPTTKCITASYASCLKYKSKIPIIISTDTIDF